MGVLRKALPAKMASQNVSKKRKFVADGVFNAELNELLIRELAEDGYSGVEIRQSPARHEIIIRATRTQNVLGEKGRRIRELTAVVQKRFNFPPGSVELYAEKVLNRGLCAVAQCESLRYKLLGERRSRLRGGCVWQGQRQRAKAMKFSDGYMIAAGFPKRNFIDSAVRHVLLRQGCLWIKVKIMLPHDPTGKAGSKTPMPDKVDVFEPKEDVIVAPTKDAAAAY